MRIGRVRLAAALATGGAAAELDLAAGRLRVLHVQGFRGEPEAPPPIER